MVGIDFKINEMTPEMARVLSTKSFYNGMIFGLKDIGKSLVKTAREGILNPPKSGRFYKLKKERIHQASAPGQYPANITGALKKSVDFEIHGLQMEFGGGDGVDTDYAKYLQQADSPLKQQSTGTKIKARPFLTLSHRKEAPGYQGKMRQRVFDTYSKG